MSAEFSDYTLFIAQCEFSVMCITPAVPMDPSVAMVRKHTNVTGFYGNARSIRQASGELSQQILDCDADVRAVTEAHLEEGDPVATLIPRGYKVVSRIDRNRHGGGIVMGSKKHMLTSPISMDQYNIVKIAEMDAFELEGVVYMACYTPNSVHTPVLIDMIIKFLL